MDIPHSNQETISKAIDILRFPLAVMVVAIHTNFNECLKARGNIDVPFSGEWAHQLIQLFSITLTDCAVPMFFVISGYLYFLKTPHITKDIYKHKTEKKFIALMVPYICWNIVACIVEPRMFLDSSLGDKFLGFLKSWNSSLWFLRDLFFVMLFAPILESLLRKFKFVAVILFLIPVWLGYTEITYFISIRAFAYFALGAFFTVNHLAPIRSVGGVILPISGLFFLLRCLSYDMSSSMEWGIVQVWILVQMILYTYFAVLIAEHTTDMSIWKKLAASSFVIYAMHRLFNSKVSALGLLMLGKPSISGIEAFILYMCTISITVAVCYIAHIVIGKNKYSVLFLEGKKNGI